jgi:hypothetical protein
MFKRPINSTNATSIVDRIPTSRLRVKNDSTHNLSRYAFEHYYGRRTLPLIDQGRYGSRYKTMLRITRLSTLQHVEGNHTPNQSQHHPKEFRGTYERKPRDIFPRYIDMVASGPCPSPRSSKRPIISRTWSECCPCNAPLVGLDTAPSSEEGQEGSKMPIGTHCLTQRPPTGVRVPSLSGKQPTPREKPTFFLPPPRRHRSRRRRRRRHHRPDTECRSAPDAQAGWPKGGSGPSPGGVTLARRALPIQPHLPPYSS